jgi:DNA-binding transcriptional regulator YiaG
MDSPGTIDGMELKLRRVRAGLRQYQLAQELGIPPSTLCEWENGRKLVPPQQAERIIAAINRLARGGHEKESGDANG